MLFSLRRAQYDNHVDKENKCEAQTALEALSYVACGIPYPVNGQQFNYHDVTTVWQEALMLACMKVALDTRRPKQLARNSLSRRTRIGRRESILCHYNLQK